MSIKIIEIPQPQYSHFIRYNNYPDEFEQVAKNYKVKVMYSWFNEEGNTWLGFLSEGLFHVFEIPNRFSDVNEWIQAVKEGFSCCTSEQWRGLRALGYRNMEEVDRDRGEYGIDQWIDIRSKGYDTSDEFDLERGTEITDNVLPQKLDIDTFQFNVAIVDGNNIAWGDYEDYPKFKFIVSVYEKLRVLGVKPYVVVSAALRHRIDQPIELVEFLKRDDVCEAPADRPDDFFVIQLAFDRDAFIVSNDRFKDWKKANPDLADEIENRRVALTFIEDDPHFDHKLYKLIKRPTKFV